MFRKTWFRAALALTILASLVVAPLFVSAQTENGITSPAEGASVSGTVTVTGYADDPNFLRWDLFVLPGGSDSGKIWVASGDTAGEFSVTLDTTQYPDGDHALSLRVVTSPRQNYTEYITNFTIANEAAPAAAPAPATPAATTAPAAPAAAAAAVSSVALPSADVTVAGTVAVSGNSSEDGARWELLLFPNGNIEDSNKVWLAGATGGGDFSYELDTTKYPDGTHALVVRTVNADSNYTDSVTSVTFANAGAPAAAPAPAAPAEEEAAAEEVAAPAAPAPAPVARENGLALADGATVSGTVEVTGYADDPNFLRWDLFIFPGGNESAKIWVASGNTAGEFSVTLDTTQYPNGEHVFSLRVVTSPRQNYTEYLTNFVVANPE